MSRNPQFHCALDIRQYNAYVNMYKSKNKECLLHIYFEKDINVEIFCKNLTDDTQLIVVCLV